MIPTTDLRRRMSHEIEQFPSLPDLTDSALKGGRRRRRIRRVVRGGAILGGLAVVPALFVTIQPDNANDSTPPPSVIATDSTTAKDDRDTARQRAARLRAEAQADGVVTKDEWSQAVVATFNALLPRRFGGVARTSNDAVVEVSTRAGSPRLNLWMAAPQGYEGSRSLQPGSGGCSQVEQAADANADWDILDCADARFGPGFQSLATSERIVDGSTPDAPGVPSYGGALLLLNDQLHVEIGITPVDVEAPLPLRADELIAISQEPDFLDLVRLGVVHAQQTDHPASDGFVRIDPLWPR